MQVVFFSNYLLFLLSSVSLPPSPSLLSPLPSHPSSSPHLILSFSIFLFQVVQVLRAIDRDEGGNDSTVYFSIPPESSVALNFSVRDSGGTLSIFHSLYISLNSLLPFFICGLGRGRRAAGCCFFPTTYFFKSLNPRISLQLFLFPIFTSPPPPSVSHPLPPTAFISVGAFPSHHPSPTPLVPSPPFVFLLSLVHPSRLSSCILHIRLRLHFRSLSKKSSSFDSRPRNWILLLSISFSYILGSGCTRPVQVEFNIHSGINNTRIHVCVFGSCLVSGSVHGAKSVVPDLFCLIFCQFVRQCEQHPSSSAVL